MARAHSELQELNVPNPDFKKHYEARSANLPSWDDIVYFRSELRKHLDSLVKYQPIPSAIPNQVTESEVHVAADDNYQIPVTVYVPASPTEQCKKDGLPVIILLHEGGWRVGDRVDEQMNARIFTRDLDCVVLNVEYRLGPEVRFPVYVNDCYSVLKQAAKAPASFSALANPSLGIVLGGSSAGGNLAAVLAQRSLVDGLQPPVTGQWLCVACLLPQELVPEKYKPEYISPAENKLDPILGPLTHEVLKAQEISHGIADPDDLNWSPFASSVYPPKPEHKGKVARAFFQVAGVDPLRDHSLIYERALQDDWEGETRLCLYGGYGHMFWTNWPEMEQSKIFWRDMLDGMKWLLKQ